MEPRLGHLLGLSERPRASARSCSARGGRSSSGSPTGADRPGLRGPAVGRPRSARLHRVDARVVAGPPDPHRHARAPRAAERRPTWGDRQRNFTCLRLGPLPERRDGRAGRGARARAATRGRGADRRAGRGRAAVRGRDGAHARRPRGARAGRRRLRGGRRRRRPRDPGTLHALVAARLDALRPEERALLQDASVLGKSFTIGALAAIAGRDRDELEPRLRALVRKELLVQDATRARPSAASTRSCRASSARWRTGRCPRRSGGPSTWRRRTSSSPSTTRRWPAWSQPLLEAFRATPGGPDAEASPPGRGLARRGPPSARSRWARRNRP